MPRRATVVGNDSVGDGVRRWVAGRNAKSCVAVKDISEDAAVGALQWWLVRGAT